MFTECPACQTMFRVTGAILRAGHGQVECGHCHTVFDAIERLIDDMPPEAELPLAPEPPIVADEIEVQPAEPELPAEAASWVNDLPTGEFVLRDGELIPVADRPAAEPVVASAPIEVEEPVEEITLEGDRIEISGAYRSPEEWRAPPLAEEEDEPVLPPADEPLHHEDPAAELAVEEESGGDRTWAWGLLSLLLALALAVQAVHHYRQELVRHPRLGPTLLRIYEALRLPLTPNWDVTGYEIQQWGVAADPAASGTLRLRASIMNRAGFAQPYPLVKLTLEDRWGEQVGSREFEPREYLAPGTPADRMLAPGQRVNADIGIVDPGEDAVGFQVDVCLQVFSGLECASQVAQR